MDEVAALLAAASCDHASADLDLVEEHFQERMLAGDEGRREAWGWAGAWAPALLAHAPEAVRQWHDEDARGFAQRMELLGAPEDAAVVRQATRSARVREDRPTESDVTLDAARSQVVLGAQHGVEGAQDSRRTHM